MNDFFRVTSWNGEFVVFLSLHFCFPQASTEVKNLEGQLLNLCNELKQAQIKLDEAENMKRNLQDRSEITSHQQSNIFFCF